MNLKTITYDADQWQLVPKVATEEMQDEGHISAIIGEMTDLSSHSYLKNPREVYDAMLATAPQPEPMQYNKDAFKDAQTWKGMDGACAWHLIERHADNWSEVGGMMEAWLSANKATLQARIKELEAAITKMIKCKGRYHTEQNTIALAKLVGITLPQTLDKCEHETQRDELISTVRRFAEYPHTRADELSVGAIRKISAEAIAKIEAER